MSTDWNVHCRDCGETHTFHDANHQGIGQGTFTRSQRWSRWFANHASHRLAPISEYGQILGTCSESVPCECGSRHRKCVLVPGHDGDHQART